MNQVKNKFLFSISLLSFSITDINSVLSSLPNFPVPETPTGWHKILWALLILSILTLWSFTDITLHYLTIVIINNYSHILNKYPKLKPIANYYKNFNFYFIIFEIIFIVLMHSFMIGIYIKFIYF
jgi:hypothetical protein